MQSNTTEKVRKNRKARRSEEDAPITSHKLDKMRRRNQRLHRAIKEGEYQESNTLDTGHP